MYCYLLSSSGGLTLLSHPSYLKIFSLALTTGGLSTYNSENFSLTLEGIYAHFGWYPIPGSSSEHCFHLLENFPDTYNKVTKRSSKIRLIKQKNYSVLCYLRSFISYQMFGFGKPSWPWTVQACPGACWRHNLKTFCIVHSLLLII